MSITPLPPPGILTTIASVFRQNWIQCLLLNGLVIALVTSYYRWPAMAGIWEAVGTLKMHWSYAFSFISTAFAASVMPFCIQSAMGTLPKDKRWRRLVFLMLFWGYRGMEIDLFYHFQGMLFGLGNDAVTLASKVLLDQFVYTPFWALPTYLIALRWIDLDGSWSRTCASLNREFWLRTCPTVLITNWIVWIPAAALIYSLPPALQFPLFSVIMCFFILIVTFLASRNEESVS